jgi:hypothetical protein
MERTKVTPRDQISSPKLDAVVGEMGVSLVLINGIK